MDKEVLNDLYERAKSQGYSKSIEEFQELLNSDNEVLQDNFSYVKSKGYGKDISEFSNLVGFVEKKNPIVTDSSGQTEVTESTTQTEEIPGSSDGLEVNEVVEEGIITGEELIDDQYIDKDLDLLSNINEGNLFSNSSFLNPLGSSDNNIKINQDVKQKILSDYNISKALELGIIDDNIIQTALKGNKNSIEKIKELSAKRPEIIKKELEDKNLTTPFAYEQSSTLEQSIVTPEDTEAKLIEDPNYKPTGYENSDVDSMYDVQKLKNIKGLNLKDFDGYLNEQGYKEEYLRLLEDEVISEEDKGFDYFNQYTPSLAAEKLKLRYLTNYINNQVERNVESQVLNYKLENNGKHPSLDGIELSFKSGVDDIDLTKYIEEELPIITSKLKERDVKNQELYQEMKEGEVKGIGQAFKQGWRSIEDRIASFSAGTYDFFGADNIAEKIRMSQEESELDREDFMRYAYASGKETDVNNTNYLIDDKGQIYDTDLGLRVTDVLSPKEKEKIRKQVEENGKQSSTFSKTGVAIQGTGIAADMLLQIALTRGVGNLGQGIGGALSLTEKGTKAVGLISKIPMKATTASAMIAQGTLFATNLSEQARQQALDGGLSVSQAEEISSIAGSQGLALGVLTAPLSTQTVAMDKIFGTNKVLLKGALNAYQKAGGKGAKKYFDSALQKAKVYATESGKEVFQENVQQVGQAYVIGDNVNEFAKKEIMANTISSDEFLNTTILSAAAGFFMPFAGDVSSNIKTSFKSRFKPGMAAIDKMNSLYLLSKDVDKTKNLLNSQVSKGVYTEEQVKSILSDVELFRSTINSIPTNLTPETSLNVMKYINEINKQKSLKEQRDPAFHPEIDARINDLRNEIISISNFDFVNKKGKAKLKEEAAKELTEEAQSKGQKDFTIDNDAITQRAIDNFNQMDNDEKLTYTDLKPKEDAIQEPSTEEQMLQDDAGSKEEGRDSELGLQQVGEGDVGQVSTETEVETSKTETDKTSDTTTQGDTEQVDMSVNNRIESFANRIVKEGTEDFSDEALQFYAENQEAIDNAVKEKRKDTPKDKSKERTLAIKIARGDTDFSDADIDLYASSEADIKAEVDAIAKTNSQTVTADTYKEILKSTKSTTRKDMAKPESENAQRKRFWKSWNKSAREAKLDLKGKRKSLNEAITQYGKDKKGTITTAQLKAVINKVNNVNLDNPVKVKEVQEYAEKVFSDADYANDLEKANKVSNTVRKKLNSGKLGDNGNFNAAVSQLVTLPISDLDASDLKAYNEFLSKISKRSKKTPLDKELTNEASNLIESILSKQLDTESEINFDDETQTFVYKEGTQKVIDKILDSNVDGETIIKENSDFLENKLDALDSPTLEILVDKINLSENEENAEIVEQLNEYAKNRNTLLNATTKKSKGLKLNNITKIAREQSVGARTLKGLKESQISMLTGKELSELEVHLDNISEGFYTYYANKVAQKIEANNRAVNVLPVLDRMITLSGKLSTVRGSINASLKNALVRSSMGSSAAKKVGIKGQMIRSNPLNVIDNMLGNYRNTDVYDNIIRPTAEAHARFKNWINEQTDILDTVEDLIAPSVKENINASVRKRFELTTYLLQQEFESNPDKKGTAPALKFIESTIEKYNADKKSSKYDENSIKILENIKSKYTKDGKISLKDMKKSMDAKTKKALGLLEGIYSGLGEKQSYATRIVRGNELDLVNNYVHHKVTYEGKERADSNFQEAINYLNLKPGTKSKTSFERKGATAIDFDAISTALRATRNTGLDYYMSNEISTTRQSLGFLKGKTTDNEQKLEASLDLGKIYDEALNNVISNNMSSTVIGGKFAQSAQKAGYYSTLASIPRAGAELASNIAFAALSTPAETTLGMTKYASFSVGNKGRSIVENVAATSNTKLYNDDSLGGSKADSQGVVGRKKPSKKAKGNVGVALEYAARNSGVKYIPKVVNKIGETLITKPDQAISRPLWFGSFAMEFKAQTGKLVDFDKIADNDTAYMEENSDAIKKATRKADKNVTRAATSNDPFSSVLKNQKQDNEGAMNFYRTLNSYMSSFSLNEYATARQAVASMMGRGDMGIVKGAGTLAGVGVRMTSYVMLLNYLNAAMFGLLGIGDDDETDYEELGLRQGVGAATSLISRGVSGNVKMIPLNYAIESLNKEYGYDLGLRSEDKYDGFKHSLIYATLNPTNVNKNLEEAVAIQAAGPYGSAFKSIFRLSKTASRAMNNKTEESRQENLDKLFSSRSAIEIANIFGGVPLYRDIKTGFNKEQFKKEDDNSFSLDELKVYDIDTYNQIMNARKQFEKSSNTTDFEKSYKEQIKKMKEDFGY